MGCVDEEGEGKYMKAIYPVILTPHQEDGEDLILVDVPDFWDRDRGHRQGKCP